MILLITIIILFLIILPPYGDEIPLIALLNKLLYK